MDPTPDPKSDPAALHSSTAPTASGPKLDLVSPPPNAVVADAAPGLRRPVWIAMVVLALIGLNVSAFLWHVTAHNTGLPGCGGPSDGAPGWIDCEHVLASRYSKFFGQPVSMPATILYAALVAIFLWLGPRATSERLRHIYPSLILLVGAAGGAAAWFIWLQLFQFKAICVYCMTAHACSLGLMVLVLWNTPMRKGPTDGTPHRRHMSIGGAVFFLLLGMMGATALPQGIVPEITVTKQPQVRANSSTGHGVDRAVTMINGTIKVKPSDLPLLGSPDAANIVVDLFDYTCPHCRVMHQYLAEARRRFGDQVAVIPLAVPMDSECNPDWKDTQSRHLHACRLAKLGLAVWRTKPGALAGFDDWMFEPENPRTLEEATAYAANLVGGEAALTKALEDPWIASRIKGNIVFYELTGGGSIPKLVSGNLILAGQPGSAKRLYKVFEDDLGMVPMPGADTQPTTEPSTQP